MAPLPSELEAVAQRRTNAIKALVAYCSVEELRASRMENAAGFDLLYTELPDVNRVGEFRVIGAPQELCARYQHRLPR